RRDLLESVLANVPLEVQVAERVAGPAGEALARVAKAGYEGLLAKQRRSVYEPRRSRAWLKLKAFNTQELAIVGYTASTKAPSSQIGALLLGVVEDGELVYAGKVGTGFSTPKRRELLRELRKDRLDEPGLKGAPRMRDAVWVKPRLVAQVRFTEWTSDGKL